MYMAEDIKKIIQEAAKATAKEVRHQFDLVIEDLERGTLQAINEQLDTHTKEIKGVRQDLVSLKKDTAAMKDDVVAIKTTLEAVNLVDLKQEVADLKKRVAALEAGASK